MKISFIVSERQTNSKVVKHLHKTYKSCSLEEAEVLVCVGGDGFMLHTLHNYNHLNKPIYGINFGTLGFLLNEYLPDSNLLDLISTANQHTVRPLTVEILTNNNKKVNHIAFNEVAIIRDTEPSAILELQIDNSTTLSKLTADGLLVATPIGSTAYNRSCGGPVLSLDSKLLAITPINPFKPLAWKGAIIKDKHIVNINNLYSDRAIKVQFDFQSVTNVQSVQIKLSDSHHAKLLFNQDADLEQKIFCTQFSKE